MKLLVEILFYTFVFAIAVQLFYALYFYFRLSFYKSVKGTFSAPISVIICAKDELDNLRKNLPYFLEQNYSEYEVIVVDDQSKDGSRFLLKELEQKYSHLHVVTIDESVNSRVGKKFALTIGIKSAKYDYLLLSDADCVPTSKNWISTMTSQFSDKDIVLGVSQYDKRKGWLNKFIRYDEFLVMLQYLSFALAKTSYMGVGRNLAYKKSLFFSVKGFASHIHIASGDDDLFIKEVATKNNVAIQFSEDSETISDPKNTFKDWVYQRQRHISTVKHYKTIHKLLLFLFPFSTTLFWFVSIPLFVLHPDIILIISLFSFRILLYYVVYFSTMKKLRTFDLFYFYPIMECSHLFVQFFFVLLKSRYKTNSWR